MPRTRTRSYTSTQQLRNPDGSPYKAAERATLPCEWMLEDPVANGHYASHVKVSPKGAPKAVVYTNGLYYDYIDYGLDVDDVKNGLPWGDFYKEMLVQPKFLSNNDFELIPTLLDLDGTLAMFTKKFWKELNYGALTWGVLPFVSDIKALLTSIRDISQRVNSAGSQLFEDEISRTFVYPHNPLVPNRPGYEIKLTRHMSGFCKASPPPGMDKRIDRALFLLDELGVHPDLKTAWDVIPLSFVVDYFIPIGDILESLHPRGWSQHSFSFIGWESYKAEGKMTTWTSAAGAKCEPYVNTFTWYVRSHGVSALASKVPPPIEWEAPSPKQLFNTAYLTTALKRVF